MVMTNVQQETLNILIVEDDQDTAEVVSTLLSNAGFHTTTVDRGDEALNAIFEQNHDLVLLDLMLPDMHGLDVLRAVRMKSFMPMIVLSGYGKEPERVVALESGADDYMSKPFSPEELVARVRALLRRIEWSPKPETRLVIRQLELDMPRRIAYMKGRRLHLTPIEYGILLMLMREAGNVVSHDDLIKTVWGGEYGDDFSVLRVNVSRLRQKIEENPRRPHYIVTAPGQGYWMPFTK
jgi:two-component system, OmpR family, KDP operon response regulator KdpE